MTTRSGSSLFVRVIMTTTRSGISPDNTPWYTIVGRLHGRGRIVDMNHHKEIMLGESNVLPGVSVSMAWVLEQYLLSLVAVVRQHSSAENLVPGSKDGATTRYQSTTPHHASALSSLLLLGPQTIGLLSSRDQSIKKGLISLLRANLQTSTPPPQASTQRCGLCGPATNLQPSFA